jgi:hypothetical protein
MSIFNSVNIQAYTASDELLINTDTEITHKLYVYDGVSLAAPETIEAELYSKPKNSRSVSLVTATVDVSEDVLDSRAYLFTVTIPSASYTTGDALFYKLIVTMSDDLSYEVEVDLDAQGG